MFTKVYTNNYSGNIVRALRVTSDNMGLIASELPSRFCIDESANRLVYKGDRHEHIIDIGDYVAMVLETGDWTWYYGKHFERTFTLKDPKAKDDIRDTIKEEDKLMDTKRYRDNHSGDIVRAIKVTLENMHQIAKDVPERFCMHIDVGCLVYRAWHPQKLLVGYYVVQLMTGDWTWYEPDAFNGRFTLDEPETIPVIRSAVIMPDKLSEPALIEMLRTVTHELLTRMNDSAVNQRKAKTTIEKIEARLAKTGGTDNLSRKDFIDLAEALKNKEAAEATSDMLHRRFWGSLLRDVLDRLDKAQKSEDQRKQDRKE